MESRGFTGGDIAREPARRCVGSLRCQCGRTGRDRRAGSGYVRSGFWVARCVSRRELSSNLVVHDRAAVDAGSTKDRAATESDGYDRAVGRNNRLRCARWIAGRRSRESGEKGGDELVAHATRSLSAAGGAGTFVQGNRGCGRDNRRRRSSSLSQRDARCEGVSG